MPPKDPGYESNSLHASGIHEPFAQQCSGTHPTLYEPAALGFQHPVSWTCDDKNRSNSQRLGRKDPRECQEQEKQPANQAQELGQNTKQPAVETPGLPLPMVLHAMPQETAVTSGPTHPNPHAAEQGSLAARPSTKPDRQRHVKPTCKPSTTSCNYNHPTDKHHTEPAILDASITTSINSANKLTFDTAHKSSNMQYTMHAEPHSKADTSTHAEGGIIEPLHHNLLHPTTDSQQQQEQAEQQLLQAMVIQCQKVERQQQASSHPDFSSGAVPGFGTTKRKAQSSQFVAQKHYKADPANENDKPASATDQQPSHEQTDKRESPPPTREASHIPQDPVVSHTEPEYAEIFVLSEGAIPMPVKIPFGHTAGQIATAFAKLQGVDVTCIAVCSAMGTPIPLTAIAAPGVVYAMRDIRTHKNMPCQATLPIEQRQVPKFMDDTREILLWQQAGWVAFDEMTFFMQMAANSYPGKFKPPMDLSLADQHALSSFVIHLLTEAGTSKEATYVPVLIHGHWFPVAAVPQTGDPDSFKLCAPPAQAAVFARAVQATLGETGIEFAPLPIPTLFHADCGFQTVGWIMSLACHDEQAHTVQDFQASHWRQLFHVHLIATGRHHHVPRVSLKVGGTQSTLDELIQLVSEHGVAKDRSHECASHLISVLGQTTVQQILKSPQPWTDLKARTNMCRPPIRIVLVEELKAMIGEKMRQQGPIGKKTNKIKNSKAPPILRLKADQIEVPMGVFKQQDGQELGQLTQTQINTHSKGILVANIDEALPYFTLQQPLSTEGIGLLVLDHHDPRLPHQHVTVRVPAICKATGDPLIATAAIFQLGHKAVTRNMPEEAVHVQEFPHRVLRVAMYRDQLPVAWDLVCQGPVKQLMDTQCMQSVKQADILDVWDRQFLTDSLQKADPKQAVVFMQFSSRSQASRPKLNRSTKHCTSSSTTSLNLR